ncbi:serine hydrolase domain-containing protein [Streptomyces sp. NPDC051183]|uniref:serine hydrolase domain-containing protein n=1 Tax=unclassified Streptomyces TaxID=2593676 RepID=UPI0034277BDA
MSGLGDILEREVDSGSLPGAVALVARGDRVEVAAVGSADAEGSAPMVRDSLFRVASITKIVTAAAVMALVEEGRFALTDPVAPWLPELASPVVVRTPSSPVDDVVPAERAVTVADLLTSRAGWGFPSDFSLPAVGPLFELGQGVDRPQLTAAPDDWMAALARIPMLGQPGEAWLYNTSSDVLGVLIARVAGCPLPEFLAERIFEPLGMADTGFAVPHGDRGRFTGCYRTGPRGGLELVDAPDGQWSSVPAFPSGAGGLVSTVDDLHAFARMLLDGGGPLLSADSVRRMTTDWLTPAQRAGAELFLEGQGWGFGGSVDIAPRDPWNVPGRYGWIGGTGTAAHVTPSTGAVSILLTQLEMSGPTPPALMREFWTYAAS